MNTSPEVISIPYIVDPAQLSVGSRGAILLRQPTKIENFPNSSCIKKIWLYQDAETDYTALKVFFVEKEPKTNRRWKKKPANNYSVYEYDHASPQDILTIFDMLVAARDAGKSVGRLYNTYLRCNPEIGPSYAVA